MLRYYHYRRLPKEAKPAYKVITAAIRSFSPYVTVEVANKNIQAVLDAVKDDNPHFFFVRWYSIFNRIERRGKLVTIHIYYLMGRSAAVPLWKKAREIAPTLKGNNDLQTIKKVHDYLARHTRYDKRVYDAGGFRANDHNMIGALFERVAVCEGIARAAQFLLRELRVDCTYQSGYVSTANGPAPHAWNLVFIRGKVRKVDVTWDLSRDGYRISYDYFCVDT